MRLPFLKYSPSGNTTILVRLDAPESAPACSGRALSLPPAERAAAAAEIIAPDHLGAEQAGFVRLDGSLPRLDMMGGEFCVNATRALASLLLDEGRLQPEPRPESVAESACGGATDRDGEEGWLSGQVSVSGADAPLTVRARRMGGRGRTETAVRLDRPSPACLERPGPGLRLVRLPGITHLVLDADRHPLPPDGRADEFFARYDLLEEEAAGCIWLRRANETPISPQPAALPDPGEMKRDRTAADPGGLTRPHWLLTPFVRVRDTGTVCAESACGSGSLAAALVIAAREDAPFRTHAFIQPGGEIIDVRLDADAAWISGMVRLVARGEVWIDCLAE